MISKLIKQNPYSFRVNYNTHKDTYQNVAEAIMEVEQYNTEHLDKKVLREIIESDTWIWIRVYYQTAGGFFDVHHYNIHKAIDEAVKEMKEFHRDMQQNSQ